MEHMFLLCSWVEPIWFGGMLSYRIDKNVILTWKQWLNSIIVSNIRSHQENERFLFFIAFTCWHIWKARCNFIFNQKEVNLSQVLFAISHSADAFFKATRTSENHQPPASMGDALAACWTSLTSSSSN